MQNLSGSLTRALSIGGSSILTNRFLNKGTAFTEAEREKYGLHARLPPRVESIEMQLDRCYQQFKAFELPINRYHFLVHLLDTNSVLCYAFIHKYLDQTLPVIYTPTVGEACQKFGAIFFRERGLYFSKDLKGRFAEMMRRSGYEHVDLVVITDGSRILGLGDLGANGMGISIGKCTLYVAGAGLAPYRVCPVLLDVGTNNQSLLDNPYYLGHREKRLEDKEFYELVDEFMEAASTTWPNAVIQFEDWSNNHCFDMLERYQGKYRCFNDDIQGTGAVVAAGFLNAIRASGIPLAEHRTVVYGAGSAAVGVVQAIVELANKVHGIPKDQMTKTFYLVDTKGLVTHSRGDKLAAHKVKLARHDIPEADNQHLQELKDVVNYVKPTAIIGLAGNGPAFTQEMIETMNQTCPHPIVFPLSNPTSKAEIVPADAYKWTKGSAIVASGSPFPAIELDGKKLHPSQGNNMYVFPGLGLGCSIAQPKHVSDAVICAAAHQLYDLLTPEQLAAGELYPPLREIRQISKRIAVRIIEECQHAGDCDPSLPKDRAGIEAVVDKRMWNPVYRDLDEVQKDL